ncbi:MAG: hypothetical protein ABIQ95_08870 [Bdellovibrionia bacterium]
MNGKSALTLVAQPQEFFRELVTDALEKQKITTQPETEFYLVNLLNQFIKTDRLFSLNKEGEVREEPLAIMLKEALEQTQPFTQSLLFRHIGDVSLYMAGYFQESLNRKSVDIDYYIDVGGSAYQQVAARSEEEMKKVLYQELAQKFGSFVEVLAEVSDRTTPRTEKDILRLYDLWIRTRSERAAKALQEAGILPNETIKKDWQ